MAKKAKPADGAKRGRGRPKMTDAEKAAKKAEREAKKTEQPATQADSSRSSAAPQTTGGKGFKKPNPEQVVRLVKRLESMHGEAKGITSEMGEVVAKACENQHFDRTALGMARKLYKMAKDKPGQFALTFTHLLAYCDDLELDKLAADSQGLDLNGEDDEGDDQTDLEDAIDEAGETGDDAPAEQPATGKSPPLHVVPGPAAPTASGDSDVPSAPAEEAA